MDAQRGGAAGKSTDGRHCCCNACRVQVCRGVKKGSLCVQAEYGRPAPAFFCRLLLPAQEQPFFGKQKPSSHHADEPGPAARLGAVGHHSQLIIVLSALYLHKKLIKADRRKSVGR